MADSHKLLFNTFNHSEHKPHDFDQDIDPEYNLDNQNDLANNCKYYSDDQLKKVNFNGSFSVIHLNSRSLNKHFETISEHLSQFGRFSAIGISESWLKTGNEANVQMCGYNLFTANRRNKKSGGVALYIDSNLKCKVVEAMTINIDNILECLTVEIVPENAKNIVISCVYRTPNSSMEIFNNAMEDIFCNLNNQK